jgi:hypothetical protein
MNMLRLAAAIILSLAMSVAVAGTVRVPSKNAAITVEVPDSWEPEETDKGIACESPDKVVTVFFEVAASERGMTDIIDENVDWLVREQGVRINLGSKKKGELKVGGITSDSIMYDANHKEYGPASVGFIFTLIGGKILITTFWLSREGFEKHEATLHRIFASVKPAR